MLSRLRVVNSIKCNLLKIRTLTYAETDCKSKWETVFEDAEKIVGYTSSITNQLGKKNSSFDFGKHLEKLNGSSHPILKIVKGLLSDEKNSINTWGLLILLISKSAGHRVTPDQSQYDGVLQKQRDLAQLTELVKMGHLVHTGVLNPTKELLNHKNADLNDGNKIALLTGDFLLAKAYSMLSNIRNSHVNELISSALRDLTDSEFIGERNPQNLPMPSLPVQEMSHINVGVTNYSKMGHLLNPDRNTDPLDQEGCMGSPVREWTVRNILGGGSLLGRGCESALHLAGHDREMQTLGYLFGCHAALAWQANADISTFTSSTSRAFSLVSAPVLFALHHNPSLYDLISPGFKDVESVPFNQIRKIVKGGPALNNTTKLLNEHREAAIEYLDHFPNSDTKQKLICVIDAI
ncbi:all trans-polyprenyl-diphosphate synthase PDSS2-like [Arctopsyche grandis]|uniref:all trans-polyprenyl-diphosphate synthase PDSS2-like n=1 Tax=Arctopsyche grandis TaxID=121162 RepID=UPI00406D7A9C